MGRPKYRKHCMWCGERTSEFVWKLVNTRRIKVYGHAAHEGNWEMLQALQKSNIDRVAVKIQKMLTISSPWIDMIENKTFPLNDGQIVRYVK